MSKRKYTHMKEMEVQILSMRESGMTRQEIADELDRLRMENKLLRDFLRSTERM